MSALGGEMAHRMRNSLPPVASFRHAPLVSG